MSLTPEQQEKVAAAGRLIKEAFPGERLHFCFNLSPEHDNINFNMDGTWKLSGILKASV